MRAELFGALLLVMPACATVPPGHAAVVVAASGVEPTPLSEGVHVVDPRSQIEVYDLRAQAHEEDLASVSADGVPLEARASILTFHPAPGELVALAREVGPDVYGQVVRPVVRSTVRRVLAAWRADQLDSAGVVRAQTEIERLSAARLRPFHVIVDEINIRTLALLPSSRAYAVITETGIAEQAALAVQDRLELARRRADERRQIAHGIAAAHQQIAPTLTPAIQADAATRAWSALLQSPSTTVEVRTTASFPLEVKP